MMKSFYAVLDLKNPDLVIQKVDPINFKLYRKWKNGLEEWITFYYLADGKRILIKDYKNSTGYEFKTDTENKEFTYSDNLGNWYKYNIITHDYESVDLTHRYDKNGNLIYYKSPECVEESYQYDDNNLIQKYEKRVDGEIVLTRTYQRYIARGSSEEYFMDEPLTQIQENTKDLYSERTYDMKGREILYEDEDRNGDRIMAGTKYEDKRAHVMVWKNGKFIYEYYVKEGDENYGKGFKK